MYDFKIESYIVQNVNEKTISGTCEGLKYMYYVSSVARILPNTDSRAVQTKATI